MSRVEVPDPGAGIEAGSNETKVSRGTPDADNATALLNPPEVVVLTVMNPSGPPVLSVMDIGAIAIAKSGAGVAVNVGVIVGVFVGVKVGV